MEILQKILDMIEKNLTKAMFLGGVIEQIIVPIPSPIITMGGGASFTSTFQDLGFLQLISKLFAKVSVPYTVGAVIGTSFVYLIAYFGGKPIIDQFGKYIGISWNLIEKVREDFQKTISDELFILISCVIPVVPVSLVSGFCGGFKIPSKKFYPMITIALLIRATILAFIGYKMGETFKSLANGLDNIESILTFVGAGLLLGFLYLKREKWIKQNE